MMDVPQPPQKRKQSSSCCVSKQLAFRDGNATTALPTPNTAAPSAGAEMFTLLVDDAAGG
ncbi:hypothetical protein E2C01_049803 [Portunus trituberculatus]|uniref:Uncharacterized protein n=1 Tax=Portunus trituberculatus TaxID=210409 RepID=A0A5B7GFB2_PORTR|nr:hypothetical protein [Portunus trituberculatus]